MKLTTRLAMEKFDPERELRTFRESLTEEGALASFIGVARPRSADGGALVRLFLDHHPRLTGRSLEEIGKAAGEAFEVSALLIVHRCGAILPGEPIVLAAAASAHRRPAFEATDYLMDRLKTEAVFWKREDGVDGSRWIEPTERDYRDRARWSATCRD